MTVHELIEELRTIPNQNLPVTIRVWMGHIEVDSIKKNQNSIELIWRG